MITGVQLAALLSAGSAHALTEEGELPAAARPVSPLYTEAGGARPAEGPPKPFFALPSPLSLERWRTEKGDFSVEPHDPFAGDGVSVTQTGEYREGGVTLRAEMGDLPVDESPETVSGLSRRGARFSLARSGNSGGAEVKSFAFTGGHPGDDRSYLVGAVGRLSLLETVHLKTVYVSAREMLQPGRWQSDASQRGDVVGLAAAFDPYHGRLALEGEVDYALFDDDSTDGAAAVGDVACRAKVGGGAAGYRYSAAYERTGPRYRIISGIQPRTDWEGYAVGVGKEFGAHALDLKLSRYNDNVEQNRSVPTLYRYEGLLDYSFKRIEALPLGLQYRKLVVQSADPAGARNGSDEETLAGRLNYKTGEWDLGVRAIYSQRTDLARDERNLAAATVALAPTFSAGAFTVSPDLSLKRSFYLLERQRTDEYWAGVDIRGNLLGNRLDYQVRGGYRAVLTDPPAAKSNSLRARLRLAYPLKRLFGVLSGSMVGVRGEYNGVNEAARRDSAYSLQVVVEGHTLGR